MNALTAKNSYDSGTVLLPKSQAGTRAGSEAGRTVIEFVRASDRARMFCELRNPGEDVWGIDEIVGLLGV